MANKETVTRREMLDTMYRNLAGKGRISDLSKADIDRVLCIYEDAIADILVDGDEYRLGQIGTITTHARKGCKIRIPKTDRVMDVPTLIAVKFRTAPAFKRELNSNE